MGRLIVIDSTCRAFVVMYMIPLVKTFLLYQLIPPILDMPEAFFIIKIALLSLWSLMKSSIKPITLLHTTVRFQIWAFAISVAFSVSQVHTIQILLY